MANRDAMKNKAVENIVEDDNIPIPFWVKLKKSEYPTMIICWRDFQWRGKDFIIADGVGIEFPDDVEYVQQDFNREPDTDTKRWFSQQDYEDDYILSKA